MNLNVFAIAGVIAFFIGCISGMMGYHVLTAGEIVICMLLIAIFTELEDKQ